MTGKSHDGNSRRATGESSNSSRLPNPNTYHAWGISMAIDPWHGVHKHAFVGKGYSNDYITKAYDLNSDPMPILLFKTRKEARERARVLNKDRFEWSKRKNDFRVERVTVEVRTYG